MSMLTAPPLSLYVHLPWCVRKCPYCDFNSHALQGAAPFDDYVDALIRDLEFDLPLVRGRELHSIFFGGGTPSLFPADAIDRFLQAAARRLTFAANIEITLEANPGAIEHDHFDRYLAAGINRLSFGIQSFDDGCLRRLGRIHDRQEAEAAVKSAQDAGLQNINLDLMYALPGQDPAMAERDLACAIALAPAHISHYQLTLEPNTLFAMRPPPGMPDDELAWDMQQRCQARLAAAGYAQYEISAYARPDRQCQHNLNYWRFGDYLGIGAGAHGKITLDADQSLLRRWKLRHPASYLGKAGTPHGIGGDECIAMQDRPFEFMLNALRLNAGFNLTRFETRTGIERARIAPILAVAQNRGWLIQQDDHVMPTEWGRRFANDVISLFMTEPGDPDSLRRLADNPTHDTNRPERD
ncbi:MAG: radical SAM family heme chaperone HemW [Xanthomonadaceae bacterium]|jgi:oxygen-independent coproporphyrinogen-3 oxidase|nr:radical SAM family heme chaperone HemW [Xanthomonadaceae bacterium]